MAEFKIVPIVAGVQLLVAFRLPPCQCLWSSSGTMYPWTQAYVSWRFSDPGTACTSSKAALFCFIALYAACVICFFD